jgi:hypothetical protein
MGVTTFIEVATLYDWMYSDCVDDVRQQLAVDHGSRPGAKNDRCHERLWIHVRPDANQPVRV